MALRAYLLLADGQPSLGEILFIGRKEMGGVDVYGFFDILHSIGNNNYPKS